MEKSIRRTVLLYTVLQLTLICCISIIQNISITTTIAYSIVAIILHFLLYFFLIHFKADFFNISTNQPLEKMNAANKITLFRISSLVTITLLFQHLEKLEVKTILLVLLIFVFLTDSIDGQVARYGKQITKIGQMLDSISDYSLLAVISVVYYLNNIVPYWFFYLIFCRLFLQTVGMLMFFLMKKPVETKSTWGGKITIALIMVVYVIELIRLYLPLNYTNIFHTIEYISGAIIFILYFEKAFIFFRHGQKNHTITQ